MRSESTAEELAQCNLKYYRISECRAMLLAVNAPDPESARTTSRPGRPQTMRSHASFWDGWQTCKNDCSSTPQAHRLTRPFWETEQAHHMTHVHSPRSASCMRDWLVKQLWERLVKLLVAGSCTASRFRVCWPATSQLPSRGTSPSPKWLDKPVANAIGSRRSRYVSKEGMQSLHSSTDQQVERERRQVEAQGQPICSHATAGVSSCEEHMQSPACQGNSQINKLRPGVPCSRIMAERCTGPVWIHLCGRCWAKDCTL